MVKRKRQLRRRTCKVCGKPYSPARKNAPCPNQDCVRACRGEKQRRNRRFKARQERAVKIYSTSQGKVVAQLENKIAEPGKGTGRDKGPILASIDSILYQIGRLDIALDKKHRMMVELLDLLHAQKMDTRWAIEVLKSQNETDLFSINNRKELLRQTLSGVFSSLEMRSVRVRC